MTRWQSAFPLLMFLAACGSLGDQAPADVTFSVDTVAGIARVRNLGHPPVLLAVPVLRVGSLSGGPDEFGRIRSLVADADGRIYIADNIAQEIKVFSSAGDHLRTIGRSGAGPAEFADLYSLAWLDGNLAAMDPRNGRISVLSPEGEWMEQIPSFPITGPPSLIRLHPLGADGFYAPVVSAQHEGLPWVRYASDAASDTIESPSRPPGVVSTGSTCFRADGGITSITIPQAPNLAYGFPPPGGVMAVSWTDSYRIAFVDSHGDTLKTLEREVSPLPYPDSLWDKAIRPYAELMENYPGSRCEPSSPARPRYRAALRSITFDEDGSMWVEATTETGLGWDVFDPEGKLIGTAPAPRRVESIPVYVRGGHLYQVEAGDLDEPVVAVYRLE